MCSFFFLMIRPPPRSTPFPYPTLFPSNIRLASQLTGLDLNVMTESDAEAKSETESKELVQNFMKQLDVDEDVATILARRVSPPSRRSPTCRRRSSPPSRRSTRTW